MKNQFISYYSFETPSFLAPSAWLEHIPFAFELVNRLKPQNIVELGVHFGVSYFAFCQAVKSSNLPSTCYGIDSWIGDEHAGYYGEEVYHMADVYNRENYGNFSQLIKSYFDEAAANFSDKKIDLLHIDGHHTYEAVSKDFETWLPHLSDSCIVLFHDISVTERGFGVYRLWEQLTDRYPSFSFEHGLGLGVLATGKDIKSEVRSLFELPADVAQEIRQCYHRLGAGISHKYRMDELEPLVSKYAQEKEVLESRLQETAADHSRMSEVLHATEADLAVIRSDYVNHQRDAAINKARVEIQQRELKDGLAREEELAARNVAQEIEITAFREKTKALEDEATEQGRQLQSRDFTIESLTDSLDTLRAAIESVKAENVQLRLQLNRCHDSISWKITRPLRAINEGLRGFMGEESNKNKMP